MAVEFNPKPAEFWLTESRYLGNVFVAASPGQPAKVTLPDTVLRTKKDGTQVVEPQPTGRFLQKIEVPDQKPEEVKVSHQARKAAVPPPNLAAEVKPKPKKGSGKRAADQ